ncbi:MAG: MaoC family dehydratase N-terminal domain-containing protein [Dehalococcoidia bacterium]
MAETEAATVSFQEAVKPFLNKWGPYRITRDEVTVTAIQRYCEVAEDGNPVYWDEEFAKSSRFGRIIAPPQSLFSMTFAPWWTPDYLQRKTAEDAAALNSPESAAEQSPVNALSDQYGYTVNTVAGQEVEYVSPFGPGDGRLKMRSMTTNVSEEKTVRVGKGVFITSVTEYRTEVGDRLIGRSTMVLLKYHAVRE